MGWGRSSSRTWYVCPMSWTSEHPSWLGCDAIFLSRSLQRNIIMLLNRYVQYTTGLTIHLEWTCLCVPHTDPFCCRSRAGLLHPCTAVWADWRQQSSKNMLSSLIRAQFYPLFRCQNAHQSGAEARQCVTVHARISASTVPCQGHWPGAGTASPPCKMASHCITSPGQGPCPPARLQQRGWRAHPWHEVWEAGPGPQGYPGGP